MTAWPRTLTRLDAIKLIERVTDNDDPYWERVVDSHYDETTDTMPSIYDVLSALGVTEAEYRAASGADGKIDWPSETADRNEEHYQAAMAMSEKHRKLWVEACKERERIRAALQGFMKISARPWIDGGVSWPEWDAAMSAAESALPTAICEPK